PDRAGQPPAAVPRRFASAAAVLGGRQDGLQDIAAGGRGGDRPPQAGTAYLAYCLGMIFSEDRCTLFRIMPAHLHRRATAPCILTRPPPLSAAPRLARVRPV